MLTLKFAVVVFVLSIALLYYFILLVASILLIRGTRKRDYTKLMPFMILMCIGIVIHILSIFTALTAGGIVVSILMIFIVVYFYLCVYSLYNKLRNEKLNPPTMQPYAQPVIYAAPYQPGVQYVQSPPQMFYAAQSTSETPKPADTAPSAPNV